MQISLEFLGAAGTVTGSKTLVRVGAQTYMVDCGLFQGTKDLRLRNWAPLDVGDDRIQGVILTHAHLDHSGYLPRLYKEGYRGPIYASQGTYELCEILLKDAGRLQEEDADYANKTQYSNHKPALPLFDVKDAEEVLKLFVPQKRDEWIALDHGSHEALSVRFLRSGHIIGSSFVQVSVTVDGQPRLITFTGDIGHFRSRTLKGPVDVSESDVLVVEATYGDREHPREDALESLALIARKTFERRGVLVIPAFSVGRSQEVLHLFRILENEGRIPKVPVLLDSPMSNAATGVFLRNLNDTPFHASSFLGEGEQFFPSRFESVISVDDSMMACMREGPMVVIAAAGMLNGGRILHHLKHRLPDERNTVLFVGYQAEGTKGRYLQDEGAKSGVMRIYHEEVSVEAEIATLPHLSAHGDAEDILEWIGRFKRKPSRIFVNHGSPAACEAMAGKIKQRFDVNAQAMTHEERVLLWSY